MTVLAPDRARVSSEPRLAFRPPSKPPSPPGGGGGGRGGGGGGGGAQFQGWDEFNDAPRMSDETYQAEAETGKQIKNGYKILALVEQCRAAKIKWQAAQEKVKQAQNNLQYEQKLTEASQEKIKIGEEKIKQIKAQLEGEQHKTRGAQAAAQGEAAKAEAKAAKAEAAQHKAAEERQNVQIAATSLRQAAFAAQLGASHQARMENLQSFDGLTIPVNYRRIS